MRKYHEILKKLSLQFLSSRVHAKYSFIPYILAITAELYSLSEFTPLLLLQLAPTPPPKSTDSNVEKIKVRKTEVTGPHSQPQGSKFSTTETKNSKNESNSVITTLPPFTRYSSRKCAVMTDENNFNKFPSTTSRGKSCDRTYQVQNIYYIFSLSSVYSLHK